MKNKKSILQGAAVTVIGTGTNALAKAKVSQGAVMIAVGIGIIYGYEYLQEIQSSEDRQNVRHEINRINECLTRNGMNNRRGE